MMADEYADVVSVGQIARAFGCTPDNIRLWRNRYDDFPEPVMRRHQRYPLYRMSDMWDWYINRWPDRAWRMKVYLHKFILDGSGLKESDSFDFGPTPEARGYLKAVRDYEYGDWKVWSSPLGFVAEKDGHTHIWALDPAEEPQEWFIYEQRYKAAGRRE